LQRHGNDAVAVAKATGVDKSYLYKMMRRIELIRRYRARPRSLRERADARRVRIVWIRREKSARSCSCLASASFRAQHLDDDDVDFARELAGGETYSVVVRRPKRAFVVA
jgi:hypothetical protein